MKGRGNGVILKFKPDWKSLVKGSFRNSDPSNSSNPSVTALRPKGRLQKPHSQNLSAKATGGKGGGYWGCPSHKVKGHAAVCFFQIYLSAVDTQVAVVPPAPPVLSFVANFVQECAFWDTPIRQWNFPSAKGVTPTSDSVTGVSETVPRS